jgi:hypothetical protein
MKTRTLLVVAFALCVLPVYATSNYHYGANEYDTIIDGLSPDGKYAITSHGGGDDGYDNFHIYLTDVVTGKKIGPLEEITGTLDTGSDAFAAKWSSDSTQVSIVYRIDHHEPLKVVSYRIGNRRAYPLRGPVDATDEQTTYWQSEGSGSKKSPRIFGAKAPETDGN